MNDIVVMLKRHLIVQRKLLFVKGVSVDPRWTTDPLRPKRVDSFR